MQKVLKSFMCVVAMVAGCDSSDSTTDLNTDGPPMIEQVRMVELYTDTTGATNLERTVFAFGTHPEATPDQEHEVKAAKPGSTTSPNHFRIIMDELLVGNALEEISCRGTVDEDTWGTVPINSTPDDIAKCAVPQDVLESSCKGANAVCLCQKPDGCLVGANQIAMGHPVGVLDTNQDGAADDTRFINGAVSIDCAGTNVPIDLQASFWEPSGNQNVPAHGGFEVLGPAIVLVPAGAMPTGTKCGLKFADNVVDKSGNGVCAPPGGVITDTCTPGDVSAFSFTVQALTLSLQGISEGQTQVSTTDSLIVSASAPLLLTTVTNANFVVTNTDAGNAVVPTTVTPLGIVAGPPMTASGAQIKPTGAFPANTHLRLTVTGVTDAFGKPPAAPLVVNFQTGT